MDPDEIDGTGGIASKPPATDGFHRLTKRVKRKMTSTKTDPKFLKKMNASFPDVTCTTDRFVDIAGHRSASRHSNGPGVRTVTAAEADIQEVGTNAAAHAHAAARGDADADECPDIRDGTANCLSKEWICEVCNRELVYIRKDAERVCPDCGLSHPYQEMTREDCIRQGYVSNTTYMYKRQNHFKTWLKRTQGKETTKVDKEVVDHVRLELKKQRIDDMTTVSHNKIRDILKKLRLNKHYNNCVQITSIITGVTPPQMTSEQETALLQMFDAIQEPFQEIIRSEPRQNMLSYSFLIHKFLEIMSWDEYLPYFPLLRSVDKIQYQDWIWRKLCAKVGFEYIKSTM
ncbi:unnamed protein product [Ectocarpus sp. 12 AP-2014]